MRSSSSRRRCRLKKSHVGLTFIRESDIWDKSFTERAPKLGGLIEFYRSPARVQWTPTGINVPDYPKLAQLWWQNIGDAASGAKTPQQAMDCARGRAGRGDGAPREVRRAGRLRAEAQQEGDRGLLVREGPRRTATSRRSRKLANEKPKGETIDYDTLIKSWPATPPKK